MFNSKYSKLLTVILVIAVIGIIGLLIFIGIDWYKTYTTSSDNNEILDRFDGYVNNIVNNDQNNELTNNTENTNNVINDTNVIEPDLDLNEIGENNQTGGGSTSEGNNNGLTYKGYTVIGKIEIPAIDIAYPVLEESTPGAIMVAIGKLYGPGVNEVGNTVLIGHNFRNGTFFSNNKRLKEGDKVYLTDMEGNKVTYTIYHTYTTTTNDFQYATRDTKGKREISLSTCTDDTTKRLIIWAKED